MIKLGFERFLSQSAHTDTDIIVPDRIELNQNCPKRVAKIGSIRAGTREWIIADIADTPRIEKLRI